MPRQVAIVHGWSDTSKSFEPLVSFLEEHDFNTVPIWLGDYISLDDDVKIEDVAKRMEQVVREKIATDGLSESFDLIVHSTGALVARQWLATYYPDGRNCPIRRLLMLAPANFGSALASIGQSMLGRVVKGWKNWFHTGKEMLTALELGSQYQWSLAHKDLFAAPGQNSGPSPYGPQGVLPFVIVGTHPYTSEIRRMTNENGADGTVRACAANMNVRGITVDFSANEENPVVTRWPTRHGNLTFPFAVLPDRTHGSIITPGESDVPSTPESQQRLGQLILQALTCDGIGQYVAIADAWHAISEETASLATDREKRNATIPPQPRLVFFKSEEPAEFYHQYMQVVIQVVDDHGDDVPDYFLEFFGSDSKSDEDAVYFQKEVLEDVHANGPRRCFYADRTDLMINYYPKAIQVGKKQEVAMSISVNPPGDNVSYFRNTRLGAAGNIVIHRADEEQGRWLQRNCTHFVKIIIPRTPKEGVFKFTKLPPGSR